MKIEIKEQFQVVTPDDGKVLTNGEVTSEMLYMAIGASVENWNEIDKPIIDSEEVDDSVALEELKEAIL